MKSPSKTTLKRCAYFEAQRRRKSRTSSATNAILSGPERPDSPSSKSLAGVDNHHSVGARVRCGKYSATSSVKQKTSSPGRCAACLRTERSLTTSSGVGFSSSERGNLARGR
eukprot:892142-Pleurochrysis_carterae.AAC.4